MGYMKKIENLYRCPKMLLEHDVLYALEKVHGTSTHITWNGSGFRFFAGGANHEAFLALFDEAQLEMNIINHITTFSRLACRHPNKDVWDLLVENNNTFTLYGEGYGGKLLKMRNVYGDLKFIGFDVKIGDTWLDVPDAEIFFRLIGLDFVQYTLVNTDIPSINHARDMASVVANKAGMGKNHVREGIILRPLKEYNATNGKRVMAKHKTKEYSETSTYRELDETVMKMWSDCAEVAQEWVTKERLNHVLSKLFTVDEVPFIIDTSKVCKAMLDDIKAESTGEIEWSRETEIEIFKRTGSFFREYLEQS